MTLHCTTARRGPLRTLVHGCVSVALAIALIQTWLIDGLVVPCRMAGGSMAGALLGVHRNVVCGDCGCTFFCGTDVRPVASRAVCPNCGYAANDLESLPDANAQRVLIDRAAFSIRSPRRWEIVAFRKADKLLVKRVVGLPGESITIRRGDVYADGRIRRKDLAQQRALALLVHDADFPPTREPTPRPRWRAEGTGSRWSVADGCFAHVAGDHGPIDWLVYHHGDGPIMDICGYNPSQPRREEDVHAVTDVMLSLRLGPVSGRGTFCVRIDDGDNGFEAQLQFGDDGPHYRIVRGAQNDNSIVGGIAVSDAERLVEVSSVDQQFLLAIDGKTIATWPYQRPESARAPSSCPLAIGAEGIGVAVRELRVYRDVYYTHPIGVAGYRQGAEPVRLGEGEYYVLGDNSPISEDSRTWPERDICSDKSLVGKPLVAIPSVPVSFGGRLHFQVPNPLEIRYIR